MELSDYLKHLSVRTPQKEKKHVKRTALYPENDPCSAGYASDMSTNIFNNPTVSYLSIIMCAAEEDMNLTLFAQKTSDDLQQPDFYYGGSDHADQQDG